MSNATILQNHNELIGNNNNSIDELIESINNLPEAGSGEPTLQEKTITPTKSSQTITPDEKYDGLSKVIVNPIGEEYVIPSGTLDITENGTYDVTEYATANVNIANDTSEIEEAIITRSITEYHNDTITSIGACAFYSCTSLTSVNLPNATTLNISAFNNCTALNSIEIPLVQSITTQTFYSCNSLTTLNMPSLKTIGAQGVRACKKLAKVDLEVVTSIGAFSFDGCSLLDTCIIRTSSVCTLVNVSAFTGTKIANGTGYIYVPDELVDSYKTASNWSTYAEQIVPLSTYSEDELEG